ncbi:MAG: Spy/CpxP family protein refolding chaperone [Aquabacterium sp.]|uniref:Spy/CpxP family protein refolding chaperone n=1 Tax=Aquabacterium sp. TaxID=1872578 RepID=UPI00271832B9|nr:Spy/CpxP family protein refolding chaperone [Aquabacterium sp.]MDO9002659.1 Spy/CpxP family protein refolding chaperone [Aquabacterium sp.]
MGKIAKLTRADTWRPMVMASALLVISAVSAFSMSSLAQAQEPVAATTSASAPAEAHPHRHGRMGHGGHHQGGPGMLPMRGRHLDRLLDQVKATDAQRTQIKGLAKSAEADLKPLRDTGHSLRQQTMALFGQAQVDAATAEKLRQQGLANHDAVSKRTLQFALDASKVLTPEQRADLVAKMQKRHDRMKSHGQSHARLEH